MSFSRGSALPVKSSDPSRMENCDCNFAPHCSWDLLGRLRNGRVGLLILILWLLLKPFLSL